MGLFSRFFQGRLESEARNLAASGEFEKAAEIYARLRMGDEATRLLILAAEAESRSDTRRRLYARAIAAAPEGAARVAAMRKRAHFVLEEAQSMTLLSPLARLELSEAAPHLLECGDGDAAIRAYRLLGDAEGLARAFQSTGDIDGIEALLEADVEKQRRRTKELSALSEAEALMASGKRKSALAMLSALDPSPEAKKLASEILGKRPDVDRPIRIRISGIDVPRILHGGCSDAEIVRLCVRESVTIGRTGDISIPSPELSRTHVSISSVESNVVVRDLGSRNGTRIRNVAISEPLTITTDTELELGPSVRLHLMRCRIGWLVTIGHEKYLLTFGPFRLDNCAMWREAEWLMLEAGEAFLSGSPFGGKIELLIGDKIFERRGEEPPRLEVLLP